MEILEIILRLFCAVMIIRVVYRRIVTAYYLSIRTLSDGTPTIGVIMSEERIPWKSLKLRDRIDVYCHLMYPNIFYVSDFNNYSLPYGLWERMPVWTYLRNSFLITTLVCGFYYGLLIDWNRKWLIVAWLIACLISGLVFILYYTKKKLHKLKLRLPLLWIRVWEIMSGVTFNQLNIYNMNHNWKHGLVVIVVSGTLLYAVIRWWM